MSSSCRHCHDDPDVFCYICDNCMAKHRFNIGGFTRKAYQAYSGVKVGDQDKSWVPHKVCKNCTETFRLWTLGKVKSVKYEVPMVWQEPKNCHDDCYFCQWSTSGWSHRKKTWHCLAIESGRRPLPHCSDGPVPVFTSRPDHDPDDDTTTIAETMDEGSGSSSSSSSIHDSYLRDFPTAKVKLFTQGQLNDLVRDLALSKVAAEILGSRLSEQRVLNSDSKITFLP